jgi:hypothetical protein
MPWEEAGLSHGLLETTTGDTDMNHRDHELGRARHYSQVLVDASMAATRTTRSYLAAGMPSLRERWHVQPVAISRAATSAGSSHVREA